MSLFQGLQFLTTVNDLKTLPHEGLEVAFAGRSNAGKSSAINTLANVTRLAYVSKTPGRTQHINYFDFGNERRLVDLPGYGYAEVPERVRKHWQGLLAQYLSHRDNLIGLVLIMDSRRPLTELDRNMLAWFRPTGKPIHCVLTKSDKLNNQEKVLALRTVKAEFADDAMITVQLFSSLKKQGVDEVERVVGSWFAASQEPQSLAEPTGGDSIS
ncbi:MULTISPECIES: ribosome biogenesis GTP-binding protein YihA/YsxC [Deefgea]|uniref:Probable GTP-binding protein EngB n=1 Tax=Deefgea chitinilytica TaxID=570276 RepID=A0ABS2CE95_9NEIS|nr:MULTISPECIES: ribosome biogenesis GTP-binding protein YihA/YsxC [Deefgea]MBM5572459.1 YihA family ribosome biogenesis GTP-binding protein [Deefgea chitinilytica]MBM9889695.1 YihA family ribosome biogenesis GTP-binding protein [Deefgea sp. CFH1-16]